MRGPCPIGFTIKYGNYIKSEEFDARLEEWLEREMEINGVKLRTARGMCIRFRPSRKNGIRSLLREAAKKGSTTSGPTTKALLPPPLEFKSHRKKSSKKFFS